MTTVEELRTNYSLVATRRIWYRVINDLRLMANGLDATMAQSTIECESYGMVYDAPTERLVDFASFRAPPMPDDAEILDELIAVEISDKYEVEGIQQLMLRGIAFDRNHPAQPPEHVFRVNQFALFDQLATIINEKEAEWAAEDATKEKS